MKRLVKDLSKLSERLTEINISDNKDKVEEIVNSLTEYLTKHDNVALAANQLGYTDRAFAVKFGDDVRVFFNAMIVQQEGFHISIESNPSLDGRRFLMPRNDKITLNYQSPDGRYAGYEFTGVEAEIVQQQVQLTDGVILSDVGLEIFEDFDNASEEEQQEVIDYYIESLKKADKDAQDEIEADPELKKRADAVKFLTAAAKGEVKLYSDYVSENMSNRKKRKLDKIMKKIKNAGKRFTKKKKRK